jgi:hypothetical protein
LRCGEQASLVQISYVLCRRLGIDRREPGCRQGYWLVGLNSECNLSPRCSFSSKDVWGEQIEELEVEAWSVRNSSNKGLFSRLVYKLLLEVIVLHRSVPLGLG